MFSVETGQMSAVETGQMSAAETGQMPAVETRQMYSIETGLSPKTNFASHGREEFCQATPRAEFKTDAAIWYQVKVLPKCFGCLSLLPPRPL